MKSIRREVIGKGIQTGSGGWLLGEVPLLLDGHLGVELLGCVVTNHA